MRWREERQVKKWPRLVKIAPVISVEGLSSCSSQCVSTFPTQEWESPQCPKDSSSRSPFKIQISGFQIFLIQKIRDEACEFALLTRLQVNWRCWQVQEPCLGHPRPRYLNWMITGWLLVALSWMILGAVLEIATWNWGPMLSVAFCLLGKGSRTPKIQTKKSFSGSSIVWPIFKCFWRGCHVGHKSLKLGSGLLQQRFLDTRQVISYRH